MLTLPPVFKGMATATVFSLALSSAHAASLTHSTSAKDLIDKMPLAFERNQGQADPSIKFISRGLGYNAYLLPSGIALTLPKIAAGDVSDRQHQANIVSSRLDMHFVGAKADPTLEPIDPLPYKVNYFTGSDPARQMTDIASFGRVRYRSVYPGIDVVFYGNRDKLEYDLVLAPHARSQNIRFRLDGAKKLTLTRQGDIAAATAAGDLLLKKPVAYQESEGRRTLVDVDYVLANDNTVAFRLGTYDVDRPLIIDPILSNASFMWGRNATGVAFDASGNMYVSGYTITGDLPASAGYETALTAFEAAYVVKLNATGSQVIYATYLQAGTGYNWANGIAVDTSGNAYVTGFTDSAAFPTTRGSYQASASRSESFHAFVTKLNSTGNALTYSTFISGVSNEPTSIAIDGSGNAYIAGTATALTTTTGAFQTTIPNASSGSPFILKLNATGSAASYATYLGGSTFDRIKSIAVDAAGSAYVTGFTESNNFPLKNALQSVYPGTDCAFVTKLNVTGTGLVYSTLLGGSTSSGITNGRAIAVDSVGQAYVTGYTFSDTYPVTPGVFQPSKGSSGGQSANAFVTKLNTAGTALVFSTYLGGAGVYVLNSSGTPRPEVDKGTAIAVDAAGYVYIGGLADTPSFPVVDSLLLSGPQRNETPFITKMKPAGDQLIYSVAIGPAQDPCDNCIIGNDVRALNQVAVDANGSVVAVGSLIHGMDPDPSLEYYGSANNFSSNLYFPSAGALLESGNAFITKLSVGKYPTTVRSSANPVIAGQALTLIADVQSTKTGGSVTFMDGTSVLGTVSMSNGTATLNVSLSAGTHQISAIYSGDNKTSPILAQVVNSQ